LICPSQSAPFFRFPPRNPRQFFGFRLTAEAYFTGFWRRRFTVADNVRRFFGFAKRKNR
jgi:hypothetical protein